MGECDMYRNILTGSNIARLRQERGYSKADLAKKMGVQSGEISQLEAGKKGVSSILISSTKYQQVRRFCLTYFFVHPSTFRLRLSTVCYFHNFRHIRLNHPSTFSTGTVQVTTAPPLRFSAPREVSQEGRFISCFRQACGRRTSQIQKQQDSHSLMERVGGICLTAPSRLLVGFRLPS